MGVALQMVVVATTAFRLRPIHEEVGFNYAQTVRELNRIFTYEQIAECCGYESSRSVRNLLELNPSGEPVVPSHRAGEALWAMYVEAFGRRPPTQKRQFTALAMTT
jgi:hypothetical protein